MFRVSLAVAALVAVTRTTGQVVTATKTALPASRELLTAPHRPMRLRDWRLCWAAVDGRHAALCIGRAR